MHVLALALALATPSAEAVTPVWCSNVPLDTVIDHRWGDFAYGGNRAAGIGGKGLVDANDELIFRAYNSGMYIGEAQVDDQGNLTLLGQVTRFEGAAYGLDCNDPATLRFWIEVEAGGAPFRVMLR